MLKSIKAKNCASAGATGSGLGFEALGISTCGILLVLVGICGIISITWFCKCMLIPVNTMSQFIDGDNGDMSIGSGYWWHQIRDPARNPHLELLAQLGGLLFSQLSKQGHLSSKPLLSCVTLPPIYATHSKSNCTFDICNLILKFKIPCMSM